MNIFTKKINDKELKFNIGEMAKQAGGSVFCSYGKTDFLVTVTSKNDDTDRGFFPLIINYEEKYYASGKIPGNFQRRESRPGDKATLSARLIDRPLRPMFPENFKSEVQVVVTILGFDADFEPEMISISAVSMAVKLAKLPLEKLIAGITIGKIGNEIIINPDSKQKKEMDCELKAAGTEEALNMIEFKGTEQKEEEILDMLDIAHKEIIEIIKFEQRVLDELNIKDVVLEEAPYEHQQLLEKIELKYGETLKNILKTTINRDEQGEKISNLKNEIKEELSDSEEELSSKIKSVIDKLIKKYFIDIIVNDKYRLDGRQLDEIRKLTSRVGVIQQTHGSALFTRGETQSLTVCTLGTKSDEQIIDGLEKEYSKQFLLHYNFPPYSVGETGRMGAPGRREIGHGTLAEKAIESQLPSLEEFPYTIRLVSEILESNGSSSQATICAGTMALLNAGVPLKKHVAGIAMGLVENDGDFTILSDIAGLEDHLGDMDFKVAGTRDGITAIQMDIKVKGINREIFKKCFKQAKEGRMELLKHLEQTIPSVGTLAPNAPRIVQLQIDIKQIKDVIGKGGETINKIIEETGVKIDIDDKGLVLIYSEDQNSALNAKAIIEKITKVYKIGEKFTAKVTRIESYGAFVKFDETQDALLHISDISSKRIDKVESVLELNQEIKVIIKEIDDKKRMKVKLDEE